MNIRITLIHNRQKRKKTFWLRIRSCRKEMYVLHSGSKHCFRGFLFQIIIKLLIIQRVTVNSLRNEIKKLLKKNHLRRNKLLKKK